MANNPSPTVEELQLRKRARRRLIGAITLVAVLVSVLPMVLDSEPKPVGQDIAINIPSQQDTDFPLKANKPPVSPSPAAPAQKTAPAKAPEKAPAPAPAEAKPAPPAPKLAEIKAPPPAVKEEKHKEVLAQPKEPKPVPKAAETPQAGSAHVVLLGAFLSAANAKQRQAKLKELGIKYYEEKIKSPAGEKTGVRAGPYPTRQEAEHVLAKLKAAGIQDGLVAEKK